MESSTTTRLTPGVWLKSSYSTGNEGSECVEARLDDSMKFVDMQDSKDPGPTFPVSASSWAGLLRTLRT
jgi:hypothetical protein